METRPPIIVVMGHVDHGKTTLLDYIRKTNIAGKEAGGITQSIGAYEISHDGKRVTFIDTPGHEAFSKMRARGARVADLAILVVAADDGVKAQTKDALLHIQKEGITFIVAINKIDKPEANIEKTKQELGKANILLEGFGGNISWQAISAKTGKGVDELLDLILLAAELEELKYDPAGQTKGLILLVKSDPRRGIVASVIVRNGQLAVGQMITTASVSGKVKMLKDFLGSNVKSLKPSAPALILGFKDLPQVGEEVFAGRDRESLDTVQGAVQVTAQYSASEVKEPSIQDKVKRLKVVLKADEGGSLETLEYFVKNMSDQLPLTIVGSSVGDIYESDIKLAMTSDAVIIGFQVKMDKTAETLSRTRSVTIITSPIIYELEKEIKEYGQLDHPDQNRQIEILAVFGKRKGKQQVVGGRVVDGVIKNKESFEIWRDEENIGQGKILNLQSNKKDINQAEADKEVGLFVESSIPIEEGTKLVFK